MLFRAFRYGSVCFHPQPFYRSGARLDGGASAGPFGQLDETQSTAVIDRYRGSLEIALLSVLREFTPLPTPEAMCQQALLMINNFILGRLEVATRQSIARNDYCSAAEFTMRMLLWRTDTRAAEVEAWESSYLRKTALQAAVDVHGCNSNFAPLALCGLTDPEKTRAQLLQICPDLEVQTLDANEAQGLAHPQSQLCLTDDKALQEQLIAAGMMPGHVLLLDDLVDQFSVLPRQFVQ
jgi:hypothetical protein